MKQFVMPLGHITRLSALKLVICVSSVSPVLNIHKWWKQHRLKHLIKNSQSFILLIINLFACAILDMFCSNLYPLLFNIYLHQYNIEDRLILLLNSHVLPMKNKYIVLIVVFIAWLALLLRINGDKSFIRQYFHLL